MSKFKSVLSDEDFRDLGAHTATNNWVGFGRKLEQAILTKLAEQEPSAFYIHDNKATDAYYTNHAPEAQEWVSKGVGVTALYANPKPSKPYSIDKDEAGIRELVASAITGTIHAGLEGGETPPIGHWLSEFYDYGAAYEHIQQAVLAKLAEQEPVATLKVDSVSGIDVTYHRFQGLYDGMKLYAHPYQINGLSDGTLTDKGTIRHLSYLKRYQKWRRGEDKTMDEMGLTPKQIGEALDWLITFAENHIADASKMVPDGWQLVPIEPTDEMHHAARDWSVEKYGKAIGFEASHGCYKAMLAAAPKYTGDEK